MKTAFIYFFTFNSDHQFFSVHIKKKKFSLKVNSIIYCFFFLLLLFFSWSFYHCYHQSLCQHSSIWINGSFGHILWIRKQHSYTVQLKKNLEKKNASMYDFFNNIILIYVLRQTYWSIICYEWKKRNKPLCRKLVWLQWSIAIRWKLTHVQGFEWPYTLIVITISSTWTRYLSSIHTQITKTNFKDYNRKNENKRNVTEKQTGQKLQKREWCSEKQLTIKS